MYRLVKKKHVLLVLLCILCMFVACGSNKHAIQGSTSTPSARTTVPFSPTSTTQPSPTVPKITPTATETVKSMQTPSSTPSVVVTTDTTHYAKNSSITVNIKNELHTAIYAPTYYTNCTPVQLQVRSAATWNMLGRCPESTQSALVIQPGISKVFVLRPSTGPMVSRVGSGARWTAGTYRISFNYTLQPDPDSSRGGINIVSEEFTIN